MTYRTNVAPRKRSRSLTPKTLSIQLTIKVRQATFTAFFNLSLICISCHVLQTLDKQAVLLEVGKEIVYNSLKFNEFTAARLRSQHFHAEQPFQLMPQLFHLLIGLMVLQDDQVRHQDVQIIGRDELTNFLPELALIELLMVLENQAAQLKFSYVSL